MSNPTNQATTAPPPGSSAWARLRRLDRRVLGLVLLLPVLVAVWVPLLRGKPASVPPAAALARTELGPTAIAAAPLLESAVPAALPAGSPAAIAQLGYLVSSALAPFEPRWQPPSTATSGTPGTTAPLPARPSELEASTPPELVPSAILLSPGGRSMAIVGGVPRAVGDDVGGHTLVAIDERRVHYRRGAKDITVDLPAPGPRGNR